LGTGREDAARCSRDGVTVEDDRSQSETLRQFSDAVIAFSDDPGPENLERYLAASHALEESRRRSPSTDAKRSRRSLSPTK
jgi:hypothetical protein